MELVAKLLSLWQEKIKQGRNNPLPKNQLQNHFNTYTANKYKALEKIAVSS